MTHLTVRNVPAEVAQALAAEKTRRGESLNATVIDLLRRALGVNSGAWYDNGLGRHAWIAALAAREGATVLTTDDHFTDIGRIGSVILSPNPAACLGPRSTLP